MDRAFLKRFCSEEQYRYKLHEPWSRDAYSYASNGHILIRVPRLHTVAENPDAPDADRICHPPVSAPVAFRWNDFPPPNPISEHTCRECDGDGSKAPCGCLCEACKCHECDGAGIVREQAPQYGALLGMVFNAEWLRLLRAAGDAVAGAPTNHEWGAMYFRGDGFEIWLMPLRRGSGDAFQASLDEVPA